MDSDQRNAPANRATSVGAEHTHGEWHDVAPVEYWEHRYADADSVWSGRPNPTLVDIVSPLAPGRALDLGCGEGADTIWLARQGWDAVGLDISPTAVRRARAAAADAAETEPEATGMLRDRASFVAADLAEWEDTTTYDLVTASFLHSPVTLDRTAALRAGAARVRPGGHLLIVSHAAPPPWASAEHVRDHVFLAPAEEVAALALDPVEWSVELAEVRSRAAIAPGGAPAHLDDGVVMLRRAG